MQVNKKHPEMQIPQILNLPRTLGHTGWIDPRVAVTHQRVSHWMQVPGS